MTPDQTLTVAALGGLVALLGLALLLGLLAAVYTAVCRAIDTRNDRQARHAARTQHTAAIDDTATTALNDACCEPWWTSCGTDHDPTCPNQTRKHR